jgi:hypothetical protein
MAPETAESRMCARYWLEFPELTDEDWAEAKQNEQALLARLEEQDARWLAQSASAADGGIGEIGDTIGDSGGSEDGAGEGHGFSGRGSSGRGSRGAGSGGGAGVRVLARAPETRALCYRHFLETNKQLLEPRGRNRICRLWGGLGSGCFGLGGRSVVLGMMRPVIWRIRMTRRRKRRRRRMGRPGRGRERRMRVGMRRAREVPTPGGRGTAGKGRLEIKGRISRALRSVVINA